ncbi:flagellar basal body-associated protein FliL [Noviherbaspirillum cavernae]|nr:flagellar basal body-associated protein FliL [Noviherbaspirillum cavernae]
MKMILIVVGAILLTLAAAGGAWFFLGANQNNAPGSPSTAPRAVDNKPPVFMTMETFTVNLQTEDMAQFLQIGMTMQVADQATADLIKLNMPQVRNRLLLLLSSKKASEILTIDGKKKLAADIIEQAKQPFSPQGAKPEVTDVFFTSFVVQ